jgi:hypothetical protein
MALKKEYNKTGFLQIVEATCDCCKEKISLTILGDLTDHLIISGYEDGKLLDAIICKNCIQKLDSFIQIKRKDNTIGYC